MEKSFSCDLFGPWAPGQSHSANVEVTMDAFVFNCEDGKSFLIPAERIQLSRGGFDGLAIVVEGVSATGEGLHGQIRDECFLDYIQQQGPGIARDQVLKIRGEGQKTRRILLLSAWAFVFFIIALVLGTWFGLSWLSGHVVEYVPISVETKLGEMTAEALIGGKKLISSGPIHAAVTKVWDRVLKGVPDSPYSFKLYIVQSGTVNALAAPGGHVVIFTGILAGLKSPEELAGILAHEATHVLNRHGVRRLLKSAGISVVFSLVFGDTGSLGDLFKRFGGDLLSLSYSREDEKEADLGAVEILAKAKIDPTRFPEFFRRIAKESGKWVSILSSHPHGTDRDRYLQKRFAAMPPTNFDPIQVDWEQLVKEIPVF